ncbi:MAG: hypothetical protein EXS05_04885 [Planctomycetaceae bacterium]|nr:hypothetical protein [Planctomycetaceae bacterium]
MLKSLSRWAFVFGLTFVMGCGNGPPEAAKTTPEVTPEAKKSMEEAMKGGSGIEMMKKRKESEQSKSN